MEFLSTSPQKRLSGTAWFVRANKLLEEIPEDVLALPGMEKRTILRALIRAKGNKTVAARLLHLSKRCLYYKMLNYNLRDL